MISEAFWVLQASDGCECWLGLGWMIQKKCQPPRKTQRSFIFLTETQYLKIMDQAGKYHQVVALLLVQHCFNLISHEYVAGGYPKWKWVGLYVCTTDIPTQKILAPPSHELCYMEGIPSSLFYRSSFILMLTRLLLEVSYVWIGVGYFFCASFLKGCLFAMESVCCSCLPKQTVCDKLPTQAHWI